MSSKKRRAAIDLSLEAERSDEDHSGGGGGGKGDRRWDKDDGGVDEKEEQFKEHGEAPKEETGEEKVVVEVVVDQEGNGTSKEIKYRTQHGEEMEDDKQQSAAGAHGDGESDGAETRAQDKHVVEAAGNGDGDDSYTTMVQDEVIISAVTINLQGLCYC